MLEASRTDRGDDLGGLLVRSARGSAGSRRACARAPRWPAAPRRRPTRPSRAGGARARGSRPCGRCPRRCRPSARRVDRLVAHDVQVPRRVAARRGPRQLDQLAEPGALVGRGAGAAAVAPGVQVRQLDRAGSPPAARRGASCGRRARTCPCPWSRGSAAAGSARRARRRSSTTAPPSPNAPRFFDGKNENVAIVPSAPGRPAGARASRPPARRPRRPGRRAPRSRAIGATLPNRCTAMTAFVRGVSAARTVSAVTQHVSGSTSQKTGRAPVCGIASAEA